VSKQTFVMSHDLARRRAMQAVADAPAGYVIQVSEPTRSLEQNARMWAMLADISRQVVWHGKKLDADSWKAVFTASLKKLNVVPNLTNDGFVVLGMSTSKMSKAEMSELQTLMEAFGAEHSVVWSDERATA
jgi:hypothetical protein